MREHVYYTYILASRTRVLYVGVTSNLELRMQQHRSADSSAFTGRYRCDRLVWVQRFADSIAAITREKELKGWRRARKISLIEIDNPSWVDLSEGWVSKSRRTKRGEPQILRFAQDDICSFVGSCHREQP